MLKKIEVLIKFNIFSSEASSKEPIGPTLGQYGVPINDFCDIFNNLTNDFKEKTLIRTKVVIFSDHSFEVFIQLPSIFLFLKNSFNNIYENIFNLKRKAGYLNLNNEYLISFDKKIIYLIIIYISNLGLKKILNKKSLFKKIKGLIYSSGFLLYTY
jgi:large subunit ribosomal protein L11